MDPDLGCPKTCGSGSGTLGKSIVFLLNFQITLIKISQHACWRTNSSFWPATEHAIGSPVPLIPLILQHIFVRAAVSIVPQGAGGPNTRNQLIGSAPFVYPAPSSANFYAWRMRRPPTAVPGPGIARRIISTFWQFRRLLRFIGGIDKLCRRLKSGIAGRFGVTGGLS